MELPTISALEFSQIRESIKNYIKTKTDFKDYDFEGSNLSMLVDILAYNSMYSSYNINMAANELNLDTAVLRDNVVSHAKRLGYTPNSYTSARAEFNITVNNVSDYQSVYISPGPLFSVSQNNKTYTFICTNKLIVNTQGNSSVTFSNVEVKEGREFSIRYTVDDSNENQRFFIPNNFIDVDSIKVSVVSDPSTNLEVEYQKKTSIVGVSASDNIFFVEEVQDQKYEIIFGDDVIGRKLQNGEEVIIRYVITNGSAANNIITSELKYSGTIKAVNTSGETIVLASNILATPTTPKTDGGSEFEPIKSIKYRAPRYYAAQQRAVVSTDYESILQNIYSNADLVRVVGGETKSPPEYGKVFISIKPKVGTKISAVEKRRISDQIKTYTVGSITPVIEDAIPFYIILSVNIIYDKNRTKNDAATLMTLVNEQISNYNLDDEFKTFNGVFSSSKLICLIRDIDSSIKFVVIKPFFKRIVELYNNLLYNYKLQFYSKIKNNIEKKYTVISDPFCVKGYNEPVFLAAFGDKFASYNINECAIRENSDIYLLNLKERVIAKVGKINYETGEMNFTIVSCQDTPINIYAVPESPDITTGPDTYPNIEITDVNSLDVGDYTNDDLNTEATLPTTYSTPLPTTTVGDPLGQNPTNDIPGSTTTNPDGSVTVVDDDGTATTTNPDGSVVINEPTTPTEECKKLYDKIKAQNFADSATLELIAILGCPPPDPDIEDFTPINPDTCS
jgi:hypothetical protein